MQWRIELFGGLRVTSGEHVITRFRRQKTGALLAYLAFYRDRMHPREVLFELLWPECDPNAGRHNLSNSLSSLRHQLKPPGVPAGAVIIADRASVRLNPAAVTTDVAEFETALQSVSRAKSSTERIQHLADAVTRYRGALLPGQYENWILLEQQRLSESFFEALRELLIHLTHMGEVNRTLDYARHGVHVDPLREEAHRDLMRLYVAAGQPDAALRQYRELERILKETFGDAPSPASRTLAREIETKVAGLQVDRLEPSNLPTFQPATLPLTPHPSPLPTGTVTFLLTDIEGSTALWERAGEAFRAALAEHHALLRRAFRYHGGCEVKETGDAFLVAFAHAGDALACAITSQRALAGHAWQYEVGALKVRMALHTGDVELQEGEYHGLVLHRAARMVVAAHGGQIVCSEATAGLLQRDLEVGIRLTNLGVYRLRDVAVPERLFQVEYPDMAQREFPPLNAEPAHTGYLPLSFDRFFGRENEIAWLRERFMSEEARLITLTGSGGSGKTRLAIEAARRLVESLRGAIWFVPLADLSDAKLIVDAVLDALHLPRSPNIEPLEQVVEALSRQPSLLILDNMEHLLSTDFGSGLSGFSEETAGSNPLNPLPKSVDSIFTLLERVPTLKVLVTSRRLLNLSGEREFLVPPLPIPNVGTDSPEWLMRCESVQLFVDRAQAVLADFQVTNANASAVAELCYRLEGIPLAIELAASRAQVMSPAHILAQLEHRFDFLVSRQRDATARHRTLRAAIDWSYQLLSPELQRFFTQLSVFRGGWTVEAAEAVAGSGFWVLGSGELNQTPKPKTQNPEPDVLDYLAQLRECSLILSENNGTEMRFRMLETLREFAWEQLSAEEREAVKRRHVEYYLALAEKAAPQFLGPEQAAWREWLEADYKNLQAAMAWGLEEEPELALRLGVALRRFWVLQGYWAEGLEALGQALERGTEVPVGLRLKALREAGVLAWRQGDDERAKGLLQESLNLSRERGDKESMGDALIDLGHVALRQGDSTAARDFYEESLAIRREIGDKNGIAGSLISLGDMAHNQGDYIAARGFYEESLAIYREIGDKQGIAQSLSAVGNVAVSQGDYVARRGFYEESLAIRREIGDKGGIAASFWSLGNAAWAQGDCATARAFFQESLTIQREVGNKEGIAWTLGKFGKMAWAQGDYAAAHGFHEESLAMHREMGNKGGIAGSLNNLGDAAWAQGDYGAARGFYEESLTIQREVGNKRGIAYSLEGLAWVACAEGQAKRAARLFGAAEALREAIGAPLHPVERDVYDRAVAAARAALSEEAFATAWAEGRAMTMEQAVAYALESVELDRRS